MTDVNGNSVSSVTDVNGNFQSTLNVGDFTVNTINFNGSTITIGTVSFTVASGVDVNVGTVGVDRMSINTF
jgi:hypothetical protein